MKEFIESLITDITKTYQVTENNIIENYGDESEKIKDYNGRQLLEMIQNADDQASSVENKICLIKLTESELIIANNGEPFSKEGIESLIYSHNSSKRNNEDKIGEKGTGFRSILSWAKSVHIKSDKLSIEFSYDLAKSFFDNLLEGKDDVKNKFKEKGIYSTAILKAPKWKEIDKNKYSDLDTYIIIDLKENVKEDINEQLTFLSKEVLLFLNNLEEIKIESNTINKIIRKNLKDNEISEIIVFNDNNEIIEQKKWKVKTKKGLIDVKDDNGVKTKHFNLKIAYTEDLDDNNYLFSYLPTKIKFPFPAIVHGTFELTSNRNQLSHSQANKDLMNELSELMVETALEISQNEVSWKPLKLLLINRNLLAEDLKDLKLYELLMGKISTSNLFPSINNKYLSLNHINNKFKNNNDYYIGLFLHKYCDYSEFISKKENEELLLFPNDQKFGDLLHSKFNFHSYKLDYLVDSINNLKHKISLEKRAKFVNYISKDTSYSSYSYTNNAYLSIFIDTNGNLIDRDFKAFLPSEKNNLELPDFAKDEIKIINKTLCTNLKKEFNYTKNSDLISSYSSPLNKQPFNVQEYNQENIINEMIKILESDNEISSIKQFVRFLYSLYINNENSLPNKCIPLVSRDNKIIKSNELLFGSEYKNEIMENLLRNESGIFLADPNFWEINADIKNLKDFFKKFFVKDSLEKYANEYKNDTNNQSNISYKYEDFLIENLDYPIPIKGAYQDVPLNVSSYKEFREKIRYIEIKVTDIRYLDRILDSSDTDDILIWSMKIYPFIEKIIKNPIEEFDTFQIKQPRKSALEKIQNKSIKSYILYLFQTKKWIKTKSGSRVSPKDCFLGNITKNDNNIFYSFLQILDINFESQKFIDNNLSEKQIRSFFKMVGVKTSIKDFDTDFLYKILLELPKKVPNGEKVNKIYQEIIEQKTLEEIKKLESSFGCKYFKEFSKKGELFSYSQTEKGYFGIDTVYYIDHIDVPKDIQKHFNLVDLPKKLGTEKVNKILGISILDKISYSLSYTTYHNLNNDFKKDLNNFKAYIYAYKYKAEKDKEEDEKKDKKALEKLEINLCSSIKAKFKVGTIEYDFILADYEYFKEDDSQNLFIKVPENIRSLEIIKDEIDYSIADIFSSILDSKEIESKSRIIYTKTLNEEKCNKEISKSLGEDFIEKTDEFKIHFNSISSELKSNIAIDFIKEHSLENNLIDSSKINIQEHNSIRLENSKNISRDSDNSNNSQNEKTNIVIDNTIIKNKVINQELYADSDLFECNPDEAIINTPENLTQNSNFKNDNSVNDFKITSNLINQESDENNTEDKISQKNKKKIGDWGEKYALRFIREKYNLEGYNIIDKDEFSFYGRNTNGDSIEVILSNNNQNTGIGHDIIIKENNTEKFIEVKSTISNYKKPFILTKEQWERAKILGKKFIVYRVYNAGSQTNTQIKIINNIYEDWKNEKIKGYPMNIYI